MVQGEKQHGMVSKSSTSSSAECVTANEDRYKKEQKWKSVECVSVCPT